MDGIEQFLNDPGTIRVLQVLVLLMALLWLLTGFRFLDRKPGRKRDKRNAGRNSKENDER